MNFAKYTRTDLFSIVFFSLLSVVVSESVAASDLLTAPNRGVRVASTLGKEFDGFVIQRILNKGENVADILEEAKRLTFEIGEVAVVKLKDGRRAIVTGGKEGIDFGTDNITRIYGHSHPYHLPPTGPSADDFNALRVLDDPFSYLLEHGELYRFNIDGTIQTIPGILK